MARASGGGTVLATLHTVWVREMSEPCSWAKQTTQPQATSAAACCHGGNSGDKAADATGLSGAAKALSRLRALAPSPAQSPQNVPQR